MNFTKHISGLAVHLVAMSIFFFRREFMLLDEFVVLSTLIDLVIVCFFNTLMIFPFDYLIRRARLLQPKVNTYYILAFCITVFELFMLSMSSIKYVFLVIFGLQIAITISVIRHKKSNALIKLMALPIMFGLPFFLITLVNMYMYLGY